MFVFLVVLTCGFVLQSTWAVVDGEPDILNNGTILQTEDGDIAHITCILRGEPRPLVRWEKEGKVIKDKDEGIAILSRSNDTLEESHLFVAVTSNGRRGEYICVAVNEKGVSKQSFRITETSGGLSSRGVAAICLSVGISLFFVLVIGFFLRRGKRKIKLSKQRQRARTLSQCSLQVNGALLEEDSTDHTITPTATKARNGSQGARNGTTTLNTGDDDIAHLTCTSREYPVPSIRWEKGGKELEDQSPGVVIISCNNGTIKESHLLVAVSSDERRGTYTCYMWNKDGETIKTFVIEGQKKATLKRTDQIAIGVGIGVSLSLFVIILFYLLRGIKRRKENNSRNSPKFAVTAQVNPAIEDDTSF